VQDLEKDTDCDVEEEDE
jgi:hypothetical protein